METLDILGNVDASGRGLTVEQLEQQRMLALRGWEMRPLRALRPHPAYQSKRAAAHRALLWQGMSALLALGMLMVVSAV